MRKFLPLQIRHCEQMYELDWNLQNRFKQDQTGKIMLVIAKHDEITRSNINNQEKSGIFLFQSIMKFIYCTAW